MSRTRKPDQEPLVILPDTRRQLLEALGLGTLEGKRIVYPHIPHEDIIEHPEEQVRADLYLSLVNELGYDKKTGIMEFEKLYKIGHPRKKSDAKLDILVNYTDGRPFMAIELKSPDDYEKDMDDVIRTQLFNVAAVVNQKHNSIRYLVYHTRYYRGSDLRVKTICIDYTKFRSFDEWVSAGRLNLRTIPKAYGTARVPKYTKDGATDLRTDVRRDELQRIRKDLHDILWGGGKYQNELFFNLIGLCLVKIYDEKETEKGKPYRFQVMYVADDPESAADTYKRINGMYFDALKAYLGYDADRLRSTKDIAFDAPKVRYVVEVLQEISFTENQFDVLGDFFEGIVRGEFKQSKGQYLTHTNLIRFMVEGLQLQKLALRMINNEKTLPYIIDPACGSGAFLVESMRRITDFVLSSQANLRKSASVTEFISAKFPEHRRNEWAREYIYGIEINGDLAAASKVNMVGHGDGAANIEARDALVPFAEYSKGRLQITKSSEVYARPVNEQFDVVLSNPPFSITVARETAKSFPSSFLQGAKLLKRVSKKAGELEVATELLFIERYYQLLRPLGRLAVVLPESVFDTSQNRSIRLLLFKYFRILGIVSLPEEAFAPYTNTKVCILFAEKKKRDDVLAWDRSWADYSVKYERLKRSLAAYVTPPFAKAIEESARAYYNEVHLAYSATAVANAVKAVRGILEGWHNRGAIEDEVARLLAQQMGAATVEEEATVKHIVSGSTRLRQAIGQYVTLASNRAHFLTLLQELLGVFFDPTHRSMAIGELVDEYQEEISHADLEWWVFAQLAAEVRNSEVVLAQADEIGYKRGVRGEDDRPNDLFTSEGDRIVVNTSKPASILDSLLASFKWADQ